MNSYDVHKIRNAILYVGDVLIACALALWVIAAGFLGLIIARVL